MYLILILFSGLILRLLNLNQSLWLDEAVQVWASGQFSIKMLFSLYLSGDFNPPLYHLLLHFWIRIFGDSEWIVRLPSVIFGVASVYLLYKVTIHVYSMFSPPPGCAVGATPPQGCKRRRGSSTSGVFALLLPALLLATSPLHIYYSQEARMYSLACFTVLLAVWRFLVWKEKQNVKNSWFLSISLVLMGFSHYLTLLILPIFWLFSKRQSYRQLFLIHLPLVLIFGFYLPILSRQLESGVALKLAFPIWGKTVGAFTFKAAALLPVKFIIGRITIDDKLFYGLIASFLILIFWGLVVLALKRKKRKEVILPLSFLFLPPLIGFLISFQIPVFSYFRFLFCLPFFYLLVAAGIETIKMRQLKVRLIIFILAVNLSCSLVYLFNPRFHREDWKGMVDWLHQQQKAPVLILPQISKPFEYYDNQQSLVFHWPSDEAKFGNNDKIWLIEYGLPIFDPENQIGLWLTENNFVEVRKVNFNQIPLSEYRVRSSE